jgi:MYXO-CTERM domain-containing protein
VQSDTNSDAGGGTSPWQDALGYAVQIPLNSNTTNANPFQIGKRTSNANTSLIGSNTSYTLAPTGGTAYSIAANTTYTLELLFDVISNSQLDVTASLKQGNTVLSSQTVSDTGTAFGGTAVVPTLPGSNSIYTQFDQLMFRNSDASLYVTNGTAPGDTVNLKITNLYAELIQVPEPGTAMLGVVGVAGLATRRRRQT